MKEHGQLSKNMCIPRHPRITSATGDAWFYISPNGIDIGVSDTKENAAHITFTISRNQLARALQVIERERATRSDQ